jgi:predicted Rossmann fold flavoprotein
MAAISAAGRGDAVLLLEGNQQLGRKVLIAGNGRCNLTHLDADRPDHYHGGYPGFVRPALEQFPVCRTLELFGDLGLETRTERRGRLFPLADQAQAVVELLEDRLRQVGVEVVTGAKVCRLAAEGPFRLAAVDGRQWRADRVVLASGGSSVAKLGADRSGIDLAEGLGHTSTPLLPGLVPLESADPWVHRMQGIRVQAEVRAAIGKGRWATDTDDLLFAPYGVSGWTILNLSARVVPLLAAGPVELRVSLFPGRTAEQLSESLQERWRRNPHRSLGQSLVGLLHGKAIRPLVERADLPADRPVTAVTKAQRWSLARLLTDWSIEVRAPRSFDHAEVTIGGVRTSEVDPHTLESYLVPGLYLAGEVLDVHGDLGGFNLQWAWSSGWVAGQGRGPDAQV